MHPQESKTFSFCSCEDRLCLLACQPSCADNLVLRENRYSSSSFCVSLTIERLPGWRFEPLRNIHPVVFSELRKLQYSLRRIVASNKLSAVPSSSRSSRCSGRTGHRELNECGLTISVMKIQCEVLRIVAGVDQRQQGHEHRLGAAAGDRDLGLGVDRPARGASAACSAIAWRRLACAPGDRVLVDVGLDRPAGGGLELGGAGKSGIPCARLTASYFRASIDMPRITLSVNRDALCESRGCCIGRSLIEIGRAACGRTPGCTARPARRPLSPEPERWEGDASVGCHRRGIRRDRPIRHHACRAHESRHGGVVWAA